jgi:sporulation-control protein spo0M
MKAIDPQGTITLNIRGITAAMRNAGLDVARIDEADAVKEVERKKRRERGWLRSLVEREEQKMEVPQDRILEGLEVADGRVERWIEIPLVF